MKKYIISLVLTIHSTIAFSQSPTPAAMWHFEGNRNESLTNMSDWVYSILPTEKNQYIGCGYTGIAGYSSFVPVIFKLDNLGRMVWSKVIQNVSGASYTSMGNRVGVLNQVIKTPDGYAATGYLADDIAPWRTLVVEFDEDGTYLNSGDMLYAFGNTAASCRSQSIAMALDNSAYFVAGSDGDGKAFVAKINYSSKAVTHTYSNGGAGSGRNMFSKVITRPTVSSYEVIACGQMSMTGDRDTVSGANSTPCSPTPCPKTLTINEKDIWVVSLSATLSSVGTENFSVTFNKSDLALVTMTDVGPATARNLTSGSSPGNASPLLVNNLKASVNHDERGDDLIISADGKIVITALTNIINIWGYGDGNGSDIFQNSGEFLTMFDLLR